MQHKPQSHKIRQPLGKKEGGKMEKKAEAYQARNQKESLAVEIHPLSVPFSLQFRSNRPFSSIDFHPEGRTVPFTPKGGQPPSR